MTGNGKTNPAARGIDFIHPYIPTMHPHNLFAQGQADSIPIPLFIALRRKIKHALTVFRKNANAVIFD